MSGRRRTSVPMTDAMIKQKLKDAICDDTQWSREAPSKFITDRVEAILPAVKEMCAAFDRHGYKSGYEDRDDEVMAALA